LAVLKESQILEALKNLPGWKFESGVIRRHYEFKDFIQAMSFVGKVAEEAEAANHHPDIDIRYKKVTLALVSHDSGGVTDRDVKMATRISALK
jgi:4a-hydroxytetrahydrobiopterin dehydratase